MKILHLNDNYAIRGGVEAYLHDLLPAQMAQGHSVLLGHGGSSDESPFPTHALEHIDTPAFGADAPAGGEIEALISKESPDLVHIHGVQNTGALRAALRADRVVVSVHDFRFTCPASNLYHRRTQSVCTRSCGPACITTTLRRHCMTPRPLPGLYRYHRARVAKAALRRVHALIAPSPDTGRRVAEAIGLTSHVLPYFCGMPLRAEPRPIPKTPILTFVGRPAPYKGWALAIEALADLAPEVRLQYIGASSTEKHAQIMHVAERHGCAHRVTVLGWEGREAIQAALDRSTVLLVPSIWPETLGIVGLEAMARGVPCIGSRIGGIPSWLDHEANGLLVDPGSATTLGHAIHRVLDDADLLRRLSHGAHQTMMRRFTRDTHLDKLDRIYAGN